MEIDLASALRKMQADQVAQAQLLAADQVATAQLFAAGRDALERGGYCSQTRSFDPGSTGLPTGLPYLAVSSADTFKLKHYPAPAYSVSGETFR